MAILISNESIIETRESRRADLLGRYWDQSCELLGRTQDILFPAFCQLCDNSVQWPLKGGICKACLDSFPTVTHGCRRCGAELPSIERAKHNADVNDSDTNGNVDSISHAASEAELPKTVAPSSRKREKSTGCFHCRQGKWPARRVYALGTYGGNLATVLVLLKRPGSEPSAVALGSAMADWLKRQVAMETSNPELTGELSFDAVVSTPKYWTRRVSQRHNASELLAEAIGSRLGVPVWTDAIFQTRPTSKQGLLLAGQRRQNVAGAFAVNSARSFQGKRVLIVDDIVTSGSTMAEISSVLKRARVASVDGLCAARGVGTGGK
ncbi:MAG: phosphoribosyltransferase family protein [Planctomycetota bacterium]|nr:phosphoribosyltransferase family protein [Planctomycetota bacterium]